MTLKQQDMNAINFLPNEQLPQLMAYIESLKSTFTKKGMKSVPATGIKNTNRRNLRGLMPGTVTMSEDFNETPDCFEEYI